MPRSESDSWSVARTITRLFAYGREVAELLQTTTPVQVRLLGPLELVIHGRPVGPGGPRQRGLLALLALSAGTAIPSSRLVDLLWEDAPPPAAANTVQVYVSRLRRAFTVAGADSPLRSVSGMYVLDLPPEAIDVGRFERLGEEGRARLQAGDAPAAAERLRQALDLWRGAPVPDLAGTRVARAAVTRLESMRLAALADRIDADALLGRHAALIPELRGVVLRNPLDERFVGQLMTALYRAGQQAESFAVYGAAADRLAEELGVDPGPALRALHTRILRQDPELDLTPVPSPTSSIGPITPISPITPVSSIDPARPARASPAPGKPAPAFVPALVAPRPATADGPPVPEALLSASLVGRRAELAAGLELLRRGDVRLVTVLGPGGSGKSRLAAELAAVLSHPAGPAGPARVDVVFVSLAGVVDGAGVTAEICRVLSAEPDRPGEPATDVAVRALGDRPPVLFLDGLEQLVDGGLDAVTELLARIRGLRVVGTSRTVLGLPGERLLPLGPLPLPDPRDDGDPAAVTSSEAVRLFRDRARALLPTFEVTAGNAASVAALCRGLDGLPLAIELAAARVLVLPPHEILRRLDRRMELLAGGAAHLPERQRSMWAALDWSARLLDPAELLLFGQLSVFAGGWTLEAAEQVCGAPPGSGDLDPDALPVVDVLARLVDKSLVTADGTGRLGMLDTVRDYAREVLAAQPVVAGITRDRHAAFYAGLAEELGPQSRGWLLTSPGPSPRARLDQEAGNLMLALEHAAGDRVAGDDVDGELLGRMVAGLLDHWFAAGRLRDAERWLRAARQARMPRALRARLMLSFGNLALVGGDPVAAARALAEAHTTASRLGDCLLAVRAGAARAVAARYQGLPEVALGLLTAARDELARRPPDGDDLTGLRRALDNEIGEVLHDLGRASEAVDLWQECRRRAVAGDDPVQLAYPLVNLARHAVGHGAVDEARALVAQALAAAEAAESTPVLADVLAAAGFVDLGTGRPAAAVTRLREAIRLAHDCGQVLSLPEVVAMLAAAMASSDPAAAIRLTAASRAWRSQRSIVIAGRWTRDRLERAEAELAACGLPAAAVEVERDRGARTPFGSLRGLSMLDPGLRAAGPAPLPRAAPGDGRLPRPAPARTVIDLRAQAGRPG
jgi:predicted ATPase/DNA-binding SARP family transcriptional activator